MGDILVGKDVAEFVAPFTLNGEKLMNILVILILYIITFVHLSGMIIKRKLKQTKEKIEVLSTSIFLNSYFSCCNVPADIFIIVVPG